MKKRERPAPAPVTIPQKVGIAVAGFVTFLAVLTCVIIVVRHDGQIPVHFGLDGEPDRWGSAVEGWVVIGLLAVTIIGVLVLTKFPQVSNLPIEPVSDDGWQTIYSIVRWMLIALGISCAFIILVFTVSITGVNMSWAMGASAVVSIAVPIAGIVMLVRAAQADRRQNAN